MVEKTNADKIYSFIHAHADRLNQLGQTRSAFGTKVRLWGESAPRGTNSALSKNTSRMRLRKENTQMNIMRSFTKTRRENMMKRPK